MSSQPGSDPISNLEVIGSPSIGEHQGEYNTGSKWQMGIAVPIKNRKFEYGTVISFRVASDQFENNVLNPNSIQTGLTANNQDVHSWPSNFIQYGDKLLIGPSSDAEFFNYKESIRVSGVIEDSIDENSWANAVAFSLDRRNKYRFNSSDPVTVFGSGIASAWEVKNSHLMTAGIKKGFSSLNRFGAYSTRELETEDNTIGTNHILLKFRLPSHPSHDTSTTAGSKMGPAVFNSQKGLAPWRDNTVPNQDGEWDWRYPTVAEGVFRYIEDFRDEGFAYMAHNSNSNSQNYTVSHNDAYASVITGFWHPGGQIKDTSQALFAMVNEHSNTSGSNVYSESSFRQIITSSIGEAKDLSYVPLVSGTHYRFGLTWRGNLFPGGSNSQGSQLWAKFQWGPVAKAGSMISTPPLLDHNNPDQHDWKHDTVSGYLPAAYTDFLDDEKNIKVEVITRVQSPSGYLTGRSDRGSEMLAFIDNVWLEHQGDIPGATDKGYIEIDHFPEMGTLTVNEVDSTQTINLKLSDGSSRHIDPTGNLYKKLYVIEGDFLRVKQDVYNQLRRLLEWQKRGHKLTLHPFLPEVPHCLVGKLSIESVSKHHWDLTRFNFRFRFTETE